MAAKKTARSKGTASSRRKTEVSPAEQYKLVMHERRNALRKLQGIPQQ
jgi:hypothetical protein